MKQGKLYTKIVFAAVLVAILSYLGYAAISALRSPMSTVTAIEYEAGQGLRTTGYVVREETVLTSPSPITTMAVAEGQKVGNGQVVATGYASSGAQARQSEMEQLRAQLAQLEFAYSYGSATTAGAADMDGQITGDLAVYAQNIARRDFAAAQALSPEIKGLVLRRTTGDTQLAAIAAQRDALRGRLAGFESEAGGDTRAIAVASSGFFSGTVDGFETILTPAALGALSVSELDNLAAKTPPAGSFGRLITDPTWYYLTSVPADYLADMQTGEHVSISFSHDFYSTLDMRVNRIGDNENGKRVLVLESYDYIQDVTLLREQTANVVFHVYTGLRVPKDALQMSAEGQAGVYVLESTSAKWKNVDIIFDNGESYVVALDKSSTANLWPGDEMIVGVKDLFDGKVVL